MLTPPQDDDETDDGELRTPRQSIHESPVHEESKRTILNAIDQSGCSNHFGDITSKYYVPFELWYFRSAVHQVSRVRMVSEFMNLTLLGPPSVLNGLIECTAYFKHTGFSVLPAKSCSIPSAQYRFDQSRFGATTANTRIIGE